MIKQRAMQTLKNKRLYSLFAPHIYLDILPGRLEQQRDVLMKQVFNIENANAQVEALKASADSVALMKETNRALKSQVQQFDTSELEVKLLFEVIRRIYLV
jgi:Snf7